MSLRRGQYRPVRGLSLRWRILIVASLVYTSLRMIEMTVWLIRAVT